MDATIETEIARRYEVSGYPTIKWFRKGIAYDYDGDRTADGKLVTRSDLYTDNDINCRHSEVCQGESRS